MVDIPGMIAALQPAELETLRSRGREQILDAGLVAAIDAAAGGPGEGRGYYVVNGPLWPVENREYHLRSDVAAAIFDAQRLDPQRLS
jgi:hypothetical protein